MKGFIELTTTDNSQVFIQFHDIRSLVYFRDYSEITVQQGMTTAVFRVKETPYEVNLIRREAYVQDLLTGWEDMQDERLKRNDPNGLYEEDDGSVRPLNIREDRP